MPSIGEQAPDFELQSDEGKTVRLSDYKGRNVILYFYPADFTSGCELQACSFRDSYPDIEAKNAVVLGVSKDSVDSHKRFREALNLPFTLLADPDLAIHRLYGSAKAHEQDDGTTKYGGLRGQYIIDAEGRIVDTQAPVKAPESRRLALEALEKL